MLRDIVTAQKSLFIPGAHTELRAQKNRTRRVVSVKGNLMGNSRVEESGVSARVRKNGVYGFSSMAELSEEAAKAVLSAASENAVFMDKHAGKNDGDLPVISGNKAEELVDLPETDQKVYIDFVKNLDDYVTKKYPNLASRTFVAMEETFEKDLVTSDGIDSHIILPRSYVYVILNAETKDGMPVELSKAIGGEGIFTSNFMNMEEAYRTADELYESIMQKREGVYADAGEKTVILGGMMTGMLAHEAVGHTVEADLVRGGSVAGPNLNKRVGSELVNLTDFAHTAFGERVPLPVFADDEGTPAVDCGLIKDGILIGYMNNRETAEIFNMAPTGNARGFTFSDEPLIRMRNTVVHPGKDKLEDMIASIDDGYYLIDSGNGQADTTGEFMFGVTQGYEIKNGKLGKALLDTTVSGVAFDMLKTVDMVSDNLTWSSSGYCGKKQPMPTSMGGPELRCRITIGGR